MSSIHKHRITGTFSVKKLRRFGGKERVKITAGFRDPAWYNNHHKGTNSIHGFQSRRGGFDSHRRRLYAALVYRENSSQNNTVPCFIVIRRNSSSHNITKRHNRRGLTHIHPISRLNKFLKKIFSKEAQLNLTIYENEKTTRFFF